MAGWKQWFANCARTGALASLATTVAIAVCGRLEGTTAAAPLNAISHILWGAEALKTDHWSAMYTLPGLALNALSVLGWAVLFELLVRTASRFESFLLGGAAIAALAYGIDYYVVPERLTPGFEHRLSGFSLLAIYCVLGLSLALGPQLRRAGRQKAPDSAPSL